MSSRAASDTLASAFILAATLLSTTWVASPARADDVWDYFSARAEITVGSMLPSYQLSTLDYDVGIAGAFRLGVRPVAPLVIQIGADGWYFPSDLGAGSQWLLGGGIRIEPRTGDFGWLVIDANAGVALTGGLVRFGFNAGIAFELNIADVIGIGPQIRYGHTIASGDDWPSDAIFLSGGLAITLRGEERREGDRDDDGVGDALDVCVDLHQGPTPDPQRLGCPLADQDADGISDRDDVCPTIPEGETPDPMRRGCPLGDSDADGVIDRDDACPTLHQGETPDPNRRGCPAGDSDADGVFDHLDACPATPAGARPDESRPGCPELDTDGDGVGDGSDLCPTQPAGLHPDPERSGCPLPDRDGDSVIDRDDTCPDEFGAPSTRRERNGCPGLVRIEGGLIRIMRPVFFATARDTILRTSRPVLTALADALRATPQIRRISIEGYTDDVGDDEQNRVLSQRRAHNVMAFLIAAGVEPGRLEAHGLGETRPLVPETTDAARAVNRRVEFRIVDPQGEGQTTPPGSGEVPR